MCIIQIQPPIYVHTHTIDALCVHMGCFHGHEDVMVHFKTAFRSLIISQCITFRQITICMIKVEISLFINYQPKCQINTCVYLTF